MTWTDSDSPPRTNNYKLEWSIQQQLSEWMKTTRLRKDAPVYSCNETAESFHLIRNGLLGVFLSFSESKRLLIQKICPGETIGLTQMMADEPFPFHVLPIKETIAYRGERADLEKLRTKCPEELREALLNEGRIFESTYGRIEGFLSESVETRIARLLLELTTEIGRETDEGIELVARLNRKQISRMVGCAHESASRVMSEWEANETISTDNKIITLKKPHRLRGLLSEDP